MSHPPVSTESSSKPKPACPIPKRVSPKPSPLLNAVCALLVIIGFQLGCARIPSPAEMSVLASGVKLAMEMYQAQRDSGQKSFDEANRKRIAAIENNFKFNDPKTNEFIEKWKVAEVDVHLLRERFDQMIKSADLLFAYSEKKAEQIHDSGLQGRMFDVIKARKSAFLAGAMRSHNAIAAREKAVDKGNDIIKAIEIIGAINQVDAQNFASVLTEADQRAPEIDALVQEGNAILNSELIRSN